MLTARDVANANDLRTLRNQAAHELGFKITHEDAQRFAELARGLVETIAAGAWQRFGGE